MTLGERIKKVRKARELTQQAFADKLGLKRNTIASYETDAVSPSDRTISDICRVFGVREEWLREGVGPMFAQVERKAEIAEFVGRIMKDEDAGFQARFVSVLARMTPEEWAMLERKARELLTEDDTNK